MNSYQGKHVLIIGAARQGMALARYLAGKGARVTLNDKQSAAQLQQKVDQLSGTGVAWVLGEHPLSLLEDVDLVCVSGGVSLTLPIVSEARRRGIPVSNDSQIFMEAVKAPVVGITGSSGKTTTTTLFGRMAEIGLPAPHKAWVGGNIGNPLIEYVDLIDSQDLVIQELSSFQLELMTISPHLATILNITPNHLDRHADMAEYIRAKSSIIAYQKAGDIAVLNRDDQESWNFHRQVRGSLISFGKQEAGTDSPQVYLEQGFVRAKSDGRTTTLLDSRLVKLRGVHNLMHVLAACALAYALDFTPEAIATGVEGFTGVKHRLELVRELNGVRWINDSIATTPERTLAALNSFTEPLILLLGGRDKNLPWDTLSREILRRVDHVVVFGEAAEIIMTAIGQPGSANRLQSIVQKPTMLEALDETLRIATPGDVVLLSPGCTSYDAFKDFEERGDTFTDWVNGL